MQKFTAVLALTIICFLFSDSRAQASQTVWTCEGPGSIAYTYVNIENDRGGIRAEVWTKGFAAPVFLSAMTCSDLSLGQDNSKLRCEYMGYAQNKYQVVIGYDKKSKTTVARVGYRGEIIAILPCDAGY